MSFLPPSQRKLLNSLNPLFFILAVFAFILAKNFWYPIAPEMVRRWDILLPFVVYFGQRRSLPEGIILSLFSSHLYSLCSAAPLGVFTTTYLLIFAAARLISYVVYANTPGLVLLLMIGLSLLSRIFLPLVARFFHAPWPVLSLENLTWWSILGNGVAGWAVYALLETMDKVTHKVPRTTIELAGDRL